MTSELITIITSTDVATRDRSLDAFCESTTPEQLLAECAALDDFRRHCDNLYQRVRALFFLYAIYRFHLPPLVPPTTPGLIPFDGQAHLLRRRFNEAIDLFLQVSSQQGPSEGICSALAQAYHQLGFQTLADQVRRSVRSVSGNQWMFRIGHPSDQPLRLRPELLQRSGPGGPFPILTERTPVRMDFSHSAWSDIFFLGMDFPDGARVLNVSIDLAVRGRDPQPRPPVETYLRVIDQPVLRLASVDLNARTDITHVNTVFDFARDYLGLLKAAVIAAGIVPPGMEGSEQSVGDLLERVVGPGLGLEIVSKVNDIPKGSRLAVSTNLLGSLISICMRATGQVEALTGGLAEPDRRIVAARAILGEWLGGSGGGWQDSGGVWPGIKLICGATAGSGDPEMGISRGRLLPDHHILDQDEVSDETRRKLQESLVLVHGGMAQNVGPILEMVTEKYLLRSPAEWTARKTAIGVLDEVVACLRDGDIRSVGKVTTRNFFEPLQTIIPWSNNLYTQTLIDRTRKHFGKEFWGFWMLGGMSGGGMGFIFDPRRQAEAKDWLQQLMTDTKQHFHTALPFAMEPVVYDFGINDRGTWAELWQDEQAVLPGRYYAQTVPAWLRCDPRELSPLERRELERFGTACRDSSASEDTVKVLLDHMLPHTTRAQAGDQDLSTILFVHGFDEQHHEQIRADLRAGRIGLAQNRLHANTTIRDVRPEDVVDTRHGLDQRHVRIGTEAIASGAVAVVSLAAGAGSRWTEGAGVVKALHPFCKLSGRHRSFVEVHLAKSCRVGRQHGVQLPHVFTTSYLTHEPIAAYFAARNGPGGQSAVLLSPGRAVGQRTVPMVRDLQFAWEEMPQQLLDEQQQKVRDSLRAALIQWARSMGEGSDYTDNLPLQCLHPVGHWYELPNMLRNGTLARLLDENPQLKYLLLHNIDTLGADVNAGLLGLHIDSGAGLSFEVINRRLDDRGGGLARVDGQVRLVEGLALPREEDEFALSYYNSMTTWIDIDQLLAVFDLDRHQLDDDQVVSNAIRQLGNRIPTYITLKDVKKRWGYGQEDIYPVAQFEKLWSDMTALPEMDSAFVVVDYRRGQQLKEPAQLDGWLRDGSAEYVDSLCDWDDKLA